MNAPRVDKTVLLRASTAFGIDGKVDREAGEILGIAVNTEGEALGHGFFLDEEFIDAVVEQGNALKDGLRSRFGHPNMSASALGTLIGRVSNFRKEFTAKGKAVARGDLKLTPSAKTSPNGDLFTHVLDLAENDPDMFGTSIVFNRGRIFKRGADGEKVFQTIDEDGEPVFNRDFRKTEGNMFVELARLRADDLVDTPAANPDGLFSEFSDSPAKAVTQFLDEHPEIWELLQADDVEEIFTAFRARYAANRAGIVGEQSLAAKQETEEHGNMADEKTTGITVEELEAAKQTAKSESAQQLKSLIDEFGADVGMDAFEKGLSVDVTKALQYEAQKVNIAELETKVAGLETQLSDKKPKAEGEKNPVDHEEAPEGDDVSRFEAEVAKLEKSGLKKGEAFRKAVELYPELAEKRFEN